MQQRTAPLPVTHPVRAMTGLAKQIALPHETSPMRFPSFPALERTAVMGFSAPADLALPASTEVKTLVTRQAAFPCWADYSVSNVGCYATTAFESHEVRGIATSYVVEPSGALFATGVSNSRTGTLAPRLTTSASPPWGTYPVLGVDGNLPGQPFLYMPAGSYAAVYVLVGTVLPAGYMDFTATIEQWSAPGESAFALSVQVATIVTTVGGIGTFTVPANGWYRIKSLACVTADLGPLVGLTATLLWGSGTLSVSISGPTDNGTVIVNSTPLRCFLPLVHAAEFVNSSLPWYSTRTTAASALFTNVSQIQKKAGTVMCGRVSPQVINPFTVTKAYINGLHPAEKAFLGLETGMYTYCPPSTDMSDFWDYTINSEKLSSNDGVTQSPCYRLDNTSLVNIGYFVAGTDAEQLAVTVDWHFEFRTSSALFQIGLSTMTLESLHMAQLALSDAGFFFENPTHVGILKKVMGSAMRFAPAIAGTVNPALGQMLSTGIKLAKTISSKPGKTPPPTSAARTGLVRTEERKEKKKAAKPKAKGGKTKK